jgi:tetratricopeptide (TPR) repeat protein
MINKILNSALERGIYYGSAIVGSHVARSIEISAKLGLPLVRTHIVFSYSISVKQEVSFQDRLGTIFELLTKKENEKAIEHAKKLLEIDHESDQGWLSLGIGNRRIGNLTEAIRCFKKATNLNKSMEEAWGLLTITYLDTNQETIAKECLLNAVVANPSSEELKFYQQNLIRIYKTFGPFF